MNVYLLDDDTIFQFIFERLISQLDTENTIKMSFFTNGKDLLEHIKSNLSAAEMPEKCLFLVDLNMPIMNGWQFVDEAFKAIPENGPDVKLYIMSSSISDQDITKAKNNSKVTGYIVKPVMKQKLQEVLFGEPKEFVVL